MIKGIIPMTYCFFNRNNTIDIKLMSDQISLIKQLGSNGIACLGLATEVNKLEFSEKKKIIELVSDITNNSIPIVVTISGKNINEYKKLIGVAQFNNANWIVLQPFLNKKTTDKDCYDFFDKIMLLILS